MANEKRIDSLFDLAALEKELKAIREGLGDISELKNGLSKVKPIKLGIEGTESVKEYSKLQVRLGEELKAVDQLVKQRFASEAKLVTIQTDYARAIAKNRLELQQRNKELKIQAELESASVGSIEKARARVKQLSDERNKLNLFTKDGQKRLAELNAEIDKNNEFIKKNVDALSKQKINVGNYQGSAKIIVDALEKEKQKLEELEKTRIRVQNAGAQFNPAASGGQQFNRRTEITGFAGGGAQSGLVAGSKEAQQSLEQLDQQIENSRKVIEGFSRVANDPRVLNLAAGVGDTTKEFATFQKQLINLESAGLKNTEVYDQLKKRLAELKDQIADTKDEIKALSSDTRSFDLFAGSVTFAADAFQTAAGAAVLFGASEEEVAEQTRTLVAIQSVANGVKSIANELTTKGTAANKLLTASQNLYSFAVGKSTGAMKLFRTALLGLGITAIVFGLYKAAEALGVFGDAAADAAEKQKELDDATKDYIDRVDKLNELSRAAQARQKGGINDQERELKLLRDRGASAEEIFQKELKLSKLREDNAGKDFANAKQNIEDAKARGASQELITELTLKAAAAEKTYQDVISDTEGLSIRYRKDLLEKGKKTAEDLAKAREDIAKRNAKAEFEIYKDSAEDRARLFEETSQNEDEDLDVRLGALIDFYNEKQQILIAQKDFELTETGLTEKEKEAIINRFGISSNQLLEEFGKQRVAIIKSSGEKQAEALAKAYEGFKKQADKFFSGQDQQSGLDRSNELLQASRDFADGRIKNEEEYLQRVDEINKKYDAADLQRELKKQLALVAIAQQFGTVDEEALRAIVDIKKRLNDEEVENNREKARKIKEQEKQLADARTKLAQEVQDTIVSIIQSGFENQLNDLEDQQRKIQENKDQEIAAINELGLTEEERQRRVMQVEKEAAFQNEQIEKRKRQVQLERARFEKLQNIASIIQGTAAAVISALGSKPFTPFNIGLAATVGAIGALQLARAIATPVPKFARGTDNAPAGPAEVSEEGPEIVIPKGGKPYLTPARRSLIWLAGGEKIIDAKKTRDILNGSALNALAGYPIEKGVKPEQINNYMSEKIVEELKELNRKSRITIINRSPIETGAWFNSQFKA